MKGVSSRTRRRSRWAPRGIGIAFAIFILSAVILRQWLEFYANPANADAPSGIVASEQAWLRVRPHAAGKFGVVARKNLSVDRSARAFDLFPAAMPGLSEVTARTESALTYGSCQRPDETVLQSNAPSVFAIKESGFPRLGPPIVLEAANPIERWPGTHATEEFAAPIRPFTSALLEAGDTAVSGRKRTPVAPFAEALACAVFGCICCMTRRLRNPNRRITRKPTGPREDSKTAPVVTMLTR